MKIDFEKGVLVQALNKVNEIANSCKIRKEYENFKIDASDKHIVFEVGNEQSFLHLVVEGSVLESGIICLNALDTISIVAKLSGSQITISTSGEEVVITDAISKVRLSSIKPDLFVAKMGLAGKESFGKVVLSGKGLTKASNVCIPFEDTPQYIPGINLQLQSDGRIRFCCCSEAAAGLFFLTPVEIKDCSKVDLTLPTQAFKNVCRIVDKTDVEFEFFNLQVKITIPNGFITLRVLGKSFPKIEKVIPTDIKLNLPVKVASFNNAFELIDIIASDGNAFVKYTKQGECIISNKAGFVTQMKVDSTCDVLLKINRELFKKAFKILAKPNLTLLYHEYERPLIIKEDDTTLVLSVLEQK